MNSKNPVLYDLLCNITHESPVIPTGSLSAPPTTMSCLNGSFSCMVQCKASGKWMLLRDLTVTEVQKEILGLSEGYIQVCLLFRSFLCPLWTLMFPPLTHTFAHLSCRFGNDDGTPMDPRLRNETQYNRNTHQLRLELSFKFQKQMSFLESKKETKQYP